MALKVRQVCALLIVVVASAVFASGAQDSSTKGQVILTAWDQWREGSDIKMITLIHDNFKKKYPNIEVVRTPMFPEKMADLLRPALASGTGPDIIYPEVGIGFAGPLLRAGALMDLTNEWNTRWDKKLHPASRAIATVSGKTYAIGCELEYCPIYYNKVIFQKLGLAEPTNMVEFDAVFTKLNAAGIIPFAWGGKQWWNNANPMGSMLFAYLSKDTILQMMQHDADGDWHKPDVERAVKRMISWTQNGCFPPSGEALNFEEGLMLFYQSKAAMYLDGSGILPMFSDSIKDFEVGQFWYPKDNASSPEPNIVTFIGSGYMINAKTKHAAEAVNYLDYVCATEESARIWLEVGGRIPPYALAIKDLNVNPITRRIVNDLSDPAIVKRLVPGINMWVPSQVMTFLSSNIVQLKTKQIDANDWMDNMDKLYADSRAEKATLSTFGNW
jgi:raffinose/stachyose/melibiose transport system substrate-binding protein